MALAALLCLALAACGSAVAPPMATATPRPTPSPAPTVTREPLLEYTYSDAEIGECRLALYADGSSELQGQACGPTPSAAEVARLRDLMQATDFTQFKTLYPALDGC